MEVSPTPPALPILFDKIVVDLGNSSIKLGGVASGRRDTAHACSFSGVESVLRVAYAEDENGASASDQDVLSTACAAWCDVHALPQATWYIASVVPQRAALLMTWIAAARPRDTVQLLVSDDVPMVIQWDNPRALGIDRLLAAWAATHSVPQKTWRSMVVIDSGTATTVDIVRDGDTFCGGLIAPGLTTSLRALHHATAALPLLGVDELQYGAAIPSRNTAEAMIAGVMAQSVGAVARVVAIERAFLKASCKCVSADDVVIVLSGGGADSLATPLAEYGRVCVVPHLVLCGAALIALR